MTTGGHPSGFQSVLLESVLPKVAALASVLALCMILACQTAYAADTASTDSATGQQIVHVGFFRFDGYHNMSTSGEKSGYGYDFLQMISGYANFKYVYVGYQNSWTDMLNMLDSGEIDMLTYALKMPGYEERFDFSEHSIGSSSAVLTTSVNSVVFSTNDYAPFDGMRVGVLETNNRKDSLDAYVAERGLSYVPVYYSSFDSMKAALQKGTDIDAMIADDLRVMTDEIILDRFDSRDLYVMVKRGNTQLLSAVDGAIRSLNAASPGWEIELQDKYFLPGNSTSIPMTLSESQYIESLVSEGKTLKVLFSPGRYPLSYSSNGEVKGVLVDIFKRFAAEYGLPYEFMDVADIEEYYELRKNGAADIVLDFAESTDEAEVLGYRLTSSYADSSYSVISKNDFVGTAQTVAIIKGSDTFHAIAKNYNSRAKITYYDTIEKCIEAVESGSADCTYTYASTAQIFVIEDNANKIKAAQLSDLTCQFRLAVNTKADMVLYGLMNKAAHNVKGTETNEIYNSYLLDAKRSYTLWDYLAGNPAVALAIVTVILGAVLVFAAAQKRSADKLKVSNDALNSSRDEMERAFEMASHASAAKTQFLSQMSHDIRTPLNGIIGMAEIARENVNDPERVVDSLDKIGYSSDHLMTLINDILDLNRIESGKMVMAHAPVDLRETVSQCVEVLKSSVVNREIEVVTDIAVMEHPFVLTDDLHIRQILINIISNAVKFTPDGGKITFRTECRPDDQGAMQLVRFTVSDTGIGMSEEFLNQIFEPFVQADAGDARTRYKGSGLGMSIVKQFVDMFGGTVDIQSKVGKGTTVIVEVPLNIDEDVELVSGDDAPEDEGGFDFTGLRVLLVEDNDINTEVAQVMLESRGIIVDTAGDGRMAVERFGKSEIGYYRCILMDIMMPIMNGYEATRAIRALDRADARTVPIIAMTANAFAEDVKAALDSGMDAHVAKPIDRRVVEEMLARFVRP